MSTTYDEEVEARPANGREDIRVEVVSGDATPEQLAAYRRFVEYCRARAALARAARD